MNDADIQSRQSHLEKQHLQMLAQLRSFEDRSIKLEQRLAEIHGDHDEVRRQASEAMKLPAEHAAAMTELEARIRACEGAIGSAREQPDQPMEQPAFEASQPETEHAMKSKHKAHHR